MGQDITAAFYSEAYRLHQAATGCGSVAGVHVNMSAPEAFWTVIGVTVTFDGGTTMCTGEILNVALEFFVHEIIVLRGS